MNLWPMQMHGIDDVILRIREGHRAVLFTSPTGTGKTRCVFEWIKYYRSLGWYAVLYSNRRMLIDQLSDNLLEAGIPHGVRAANNRDERDKPVQIASIQTERARTLADETGGWSIHGLGRNAVVVVDEAHVQVGETARELIRRHKLAGHAVVGVTATPIGLGDIYDVLVSAGDVSEGRRCGALVAAHTFAPDEPDLRAMKSPGVGQDIAAGELAKAFPMTPKLFGRVIEWFRKINPEMRPSILFASGVPESLWFAEEFTKAGIPAAHIDGDYVWTPEGFNRANRATRSELLGASRRGEIRIICNRFVLREGIDAPWLSHGVFATTFGSLQSYLQAGGRLLRRFDGVEAVTFQDHGGNYLRHGSLNADRDWHLNDTPATVTGARVEALKQRRCRRCWCRNPALIPYCPNCGAPAEAEPSPCPKCRRVLCGRKCPNPACGYELPLGFRSRVVAQADGELREVRGDVFRPDKAAEGEQAVRDWIGVYFKSLKGKGRITFSQARAIYAKDHGWAYPAPDWPYMPLDPTDLYRRVCDVPRRALVPAPAKPLERSNP